MSGSSKDLRVVVRDETATIQQADWGGMTVEVGAITADIDPAPLAQGLPGNRCQCPHWGYVITGQMRFQFADRDEVFNAGDVYYVEPGHLPLLSAGTEYIEFSPTDKLHEMMTIVERNYAALRKQHVES